LHFIDQASSLRALFQGLKGNRTMRKWQCIVCGWIYDEAEGYEDEDIAPGTRWEDIPEDFVCPECGVSKEDFEMIEVG
jgi:rubredoxin